MAKRMTQKAEKALKKSIKHWEENAMADSPGKVSTGASNCALCGEFNKIYHDEDDACRGCPVFKKTGNTYCDGTPYIDADRIYRNWIASPFASYDWSRAMEGFQHAAQREVNFLKSLLPQEKKQ